MSLKAELGRRWRAVRAKLAVGVAKAGRYWSQRAAGGRALSASVPIGALVAALIAGMTVAPQGREIMLILLVDPFGGVGNSVRFGLFVVALFLFGLTVLASALLVLASDQRQDAASPAAPLLTRFEAGLAAVEPDPVHTGVKLRVRTAYLLGVAAPTAVLATFFGELGRSSSFTPEGAPLAWLAALLVAAFFTVATPRRRNAVSWTLWLLPLAIVPIYIYAITRLLGGSPETLPGGQGPYWACGGVASVVAAMAAMHRWIGREAMVARSNAGAQFVVIDTRYQRIYHALSGVLVLVVIALLWSDPIGDLGGRLDRPGPTSNVVQFIGPGATFLLGAMGLVVGLAWLIRSSTSERSDLPAMRVRYQRFTAVLLGFSDFVRPLGLLLHPRQLLAIAAALAAVGAFHEGAWPITVAAAAVLGLLVWWLGGVLFAGRPPWWLVLLVLLFMPANEAHHIETIALTQAAPDDPSTDERPEDAFAHAAAWLRSAPGFSDPTRPIVAVVVLAEGGGIRATVQAGRYLAEIDKASGGAFFAQTYAMSGVSGGAVGIATHLAAQAEAKAGDSEHRATLVELLSCGVLEADHFSALLAGLFGSDIPAAMLPVEALGDAPGWRGWFDRADFFESSLERAWMGGDDTCITRLPIADESPDQPDATALPVSAERRTPQLNRFAQTTAAVAKAAADPGRAPVMLYSTVRADDGILTASSNVGFKACADPAGALEVVDVCLAEAGRALPMSAAAHISARFPYSNPPAVIDAEGGADRSWYVDGAYFDNSGAVAAAAAVKALQDAAAELGVSDRLRVVVVHMYARTVVATAGDLSSAVRSSAQLSWLSTPLQAVLNARTTRGLIPVANLCRQIAGSTDAAACESLGSLRIAAVDDQVCPDVGFGQCARHETATAQRGIVRAAFPADPASGPLWINAPLDVAASPGVSGSLYIPLGWLIQNDGHAEIGRQAELFADDIWAAVQDAAAR